MGSPASRASYSRLLRVPCPLGNRWLGRHIGSERMTVGPRIADAPDRHEPKGCGKRIDV
jgi:hypothetical protein